MDIDHLSNLDDMVNSIDPLYRSPLVDEVELVYLHEFPLMKFQKPFLRWDYRVRYPHLVPNHRNQVLVNHELCQSLKPSQFAK